MDPQPTQTPWTGLWSTLPLDGSLVYTDPPRGIPSQHFPLDGSLVYTDPPGLIPYLHSTPGWVSGRHTPLDESLDYRGTPLERSLVYTEPPSRGISGLHRPCPEGCLVYTDPPRGIPGLHRPLWIDPRSTQTPQRDPWSTQTPPG